MTDRPLALTGGLRSRSVTEQPISDHTGDMIGLGRPLIENPDVSTRLLTATTDTTVCIGPTAGEPAEWWTRARRGGLRPALIPGRP